MDNQSGRYIEEELPTKSGEELAGFEHWRTDVWGSLVVRNLGAKFLPQLSHSNLWIENKDLEKFKNEIIMLIENVNLIAEKVKCESDSIKHRLVNFLKAIERARPNIGGVCIS